MLEADGIQDNSEPTLQEAEPDFPKMADTRRRPPNDEMGVPPTQRMSQVWETSRVGRVQLTLYRFEALVSSIEEVSFQCARDHSGVSGCVLNHADLLLISRSTSLSHIQLQHQPPSRH